MDGYRAKIRGINAHILMSLRQFILARPAQNFRASFTYIRTYGWHNVVVNSQWIKTNIQRNQQNGNPTAEDSALPAATSF